ncbi:MAG: alcohol dehydrogenase [Deltaproteobacteria bacterium RIFOXYA12_FULL_58_15]|nr:MAG: alcohol dehydrogenase [Deltaproteobacteria bacterium RIFOXYA12_FULL_58_15]
MNDKLRGNWNYPAPIWFGEGRVAELPAACRELGMAKPLLITDPGLAKLPMTGNVLAINEKAGIPTGVFSEIKANPVGENVEAGVSVYKAGGHDGVIAFGGGSALDAAKAVALMVGQKRPLWDFEDIGDWYTRVDVRGMAPVVAVPTTSGTGSEVGRSSVIVDAALHKKKIIFHPKMVPGRVICDPALTVNMPPKLTGAVGMDALSHNLEAYCAVGYHPMADGIALEGIRLANRALPVAFQDGKDMTARAEMMISSTMGATAFQKGLGAMHSVGHAIGGRFDMHHGTTIATMMPYVLEFNGPAINSRMVRLCRLLDLPQSSIKGVVTWALELRELLGIPHTLKDLGVSEKDVATLAAAAVNDPTASSNPVPLDEKNTRVLIERALRGEVG